MPTLLETDDGMDYVNIFFNEFLHKNDIKRYSHYNDEGAVFAERFNKTTWKFLRKPVFQKKMLFG